MPNNVGTNSYGENIVLILIYFEQYLFGCVINSKFLKRGTFAELDTYLVIAFYR